MDGSAHLAGWLQSGAARAAVDAAAARNEAALRTGNTALHRSVVADGLDWPADDGRWRSLWLVSHRALRRGGVRRHPGAALLVAWRGRGMIQLRGPGARRSFEPAPFAGTPVAAGSMDGSAVPVPAGTAYDTLADETAWHVLVLHTELAPALRREDETPEGWIAKPEEADS